MKELVKSWLNNYKKYFFAYKDGFFELPYLANSPDIIVNSYKSMPFIKYDESAGTFSASNLFIKGDGFFQKLEDGLWLIMSNFQIKRDLSFVMHFDASLPANYNILTMYMNVGQKKIVLPKLQVDVECQDRGWLLLKAGCKCVNTHFKGQNSVYLNIYFSHDWYSKNLLVSNDSKDSALHKFMLSRDEYMYMSNLFESKQEIYKQIIEIFQNRKEISSFTNLLLKSKTLELIANFTEKLSSNIYVAVNSLLSENEKRKILKVQHLLDESIFEKFPTIESLARKIGMSETKLKADFKKMTGTTLYSYFTSKQMQYAKELLRNNKLNVKETAYTLAYESQSKFSAAFKRYFGYLPSDLKNFNF